MVGTGTRKAVWWATLVLAASSLSLPLPGWASPPSSRPAAGATSPHARHLDLQPPSLRELTSVHELGDATTAPADRPFGGSSPTGVNRTNVPSGTLRGADLRDGKLPSWGAAAGDARVMSRAESLARRFRHEGLPVARLWENHSALVSLGLNAKGKPGLWLVQKTR